MTNRKPRKSYVPLEHDEQVVLIKWLRASKIMHFSIPNSSALSSLNRATALKVGAVLKSEGLIKGASDLVVMLPNKLLFVELKRQSRTLSTASPEQIDFIDRVSKFDYAIGQVCYGAREAVEFIQKHLKD